MKTVTFDGGFRFGDPNLRWGNPSYQLEPGDPGYVDPNPPPPPTSTPPKKSKHMAKQPFFPTPEGDQVVWLGNLDDKLKDPAKGYATKYSVSAANLLRLGTGRQAVDWTWDRLSDARTYSQNTTLFKDQLFTGSGTLSVTPAPPVLPAFPAGVVLAGVMTFALSIAASIKNHPDYSEADGKDMGLEGSDLLTPNTPIPPSLILEMSVAGQVTIKWPKNRHQGVKFQSRIAGTLEWTDLGMDLNSPFVDTRPLAHPGVPEVREYRACHIDKEIPSNLWSDVLVVNVTP